MDVSRTIDFSSFIPPKAESFWTTKTVVFLALNIISLGAWGAFGKYINENRLKELRLNQKNLELQIRELGKQWSELEDDLTDFLRNEKSENLNSSKATLKQFYARNDRLKAIGLKKPDPLVKTIGQVALATIAFAGQMFLSILTVGLYGAVQNYSLQKEIKKAEKESEFIGERFDHEKNRLHDRIRSNIELYGKAIEQEYALKDTETDLEEIKKTDAGQAHAEAKNAKEKVAELQTKQNELQRDLVALRAQKVNAEVNQKKAVTDLTAAQKELQDAQQKNQTLVDKEQAAQKESDRLKEETKKAQQKAAQQELEYRQLQTKLWQAQQAGNRVATLEEQIARQKYVNEHQSEFSKLQTQLKPLAPKYTKRAEDKEMIPGAIDLDNGDGEIKGNWQNDRPAGWVDFATKYRQRYDEEKRTAAQIFESGFGYACTQLMELASSGDKIKLNKSFETISTNGRYALYRFIALDLLQGAKLTENGCLGLQLKINSHVSMLPSQPEYVLRYKDNKPIVVLEHKLRDDFTPTAMEKGNQKNGVDPISAKWILEQLTQEEKNHLFNLLMSPVIEETHPDAAATRTYMSNAFDPRVRLVQTAYDLIVDMGEAYVKKFEKDVVPSFFADFFDDYTTKPFVKPEDTIDFSKVVDTDLITATQPTEWEYDPDVLGDKRAVPAYSWELTQNMPANVHLQPNFEVTITASLVKYKSFFRNLGQKIIAHPELKGTKWPTLTLDNPNLNKQYHMTHQMIGANAEFSGGQRCLFSNMLALLVSESKELTNYNAFAMRKAMAAYLDKLQRAKVEWDQKKPADKTAKLTKELEKLKELAILAITFEGAILKTHKCSVPSYQLWLRGEETMQIRGVWYHKANVNISDLTDLEIQLCAWTFGIKIGVLGLKYSGNDIRCNAIADEYGRIVPEADFYGPNTKEHLLLMCDNGSFYGAFPKINTTVLKNLDPDDDACISSLSSYWNAIDYRKKS